MNLRVFIFGEDGFTNSTIAAALSILGLDVIGENENESVALNLISSHNPDAVLLHIDHGRTKALELSRTIRKRFPDMGMVMVTKAGDIRLLGVTKKSLPIGLVVTQIAQHGHVDELKHNLVSSITQTKCKSNFPQIKRFTDSQIETLRLMADGKANSEIAKARFVSEKSVEQMLARVAGMLGIIFDHKHNSRVRILNSYYDLVNGRK